MRHDVRLKVIVPLVVISLLLFTCPALGASWERVAPSGFGSANNIGTYSLVEFAGKLYAGTRGLSGGCEVWRSDNGTGWGMTNKRGFGDANNWSAWCMAVFNGGLYAGTYNDITGAEVWGSGNGTDWAQVNPDGFGDSKNKGVYSLCVFNGELYAGTYNQTDGGELWKTGDGSTWFQCPSPSPWSASNQGIYSMCVFGGALYLGTSNQSQGGEMWKSGNGSDFAKIAESGFGDGNNKYVYCLSAFKGNLYAGTYNVINGGEVWRSPDGGSWTQSNTNGFGEASNKGVWSMAVFADNLYAGTWKDGGGGEVWRTPDGGTWLQANTDGFGNSSDQLVLSMCRFGNYLYCGTYNSAQGGETFRYGPQADLALPDLWYFAEGSTRKGFHTLICLQNPQQVPAHVDVTYMLSSSEYRVQEVNVAPLSRQTVDVNGFIVGEKDFATKVQSNQPIIAERPIYFNYQDKWPGGHTAMGAPAGRTSWYFAEGTTRADFDEYLCLENPGANPAEAWITYMLGTGRNVNQDVPVPAGTRVTVNVRDAVGDGQDVSAFISSNNPIVAERSIYYLYKEKWPGGDVAMGAPEPSDTWYFAEGTSREGFETYLSLQNPADEEAVVGCDFMLPDGKVETREVKVPPRSRYTYNLNEALGAGKDVSAKLSSNKPIIAERPMYFDYHGVSKGGHVVVGTNKPKSTWYFAEGTTRKGYEEWLCLQNPGEAEVEVTVTYMPGAGGTTTQVVKVPSKGRYTVGVNDAVGADQDVSCKVTAPSPIVAERTMYFNLEDGTSGGDVTMGFGVE